MIIKTEEGDTYKVSKLKEDGTAVCFKGNLKIVIPKAEYSVLEFGETDSPLAFDLKELFLRRKRFNNVGELSGSTTFNERLKRTMRKHGAKNIKIGDLK